MVKRRGAYRGLVGNLEQEKPNGIHWRGWKDNMKMYIRGTVCGTYIGLIWLITRRGGWAFVNIGIHFRFPQSA
jgi:hypothetical protein